MLRTLLLPKDGVKDLYPIIAPFIDRKYVLLSDRDTDPIDSWYVLHFVRGVSALPRAIAILQAIVEQRGELVHIGIHWAQKTEKEKRARFLIALRLYDELLPTAGSMLSKLEQLHKWVEFLRAYSGKHNFNKRLEWKGTIFSREMRLFNEQPTLDEEYTVYFHLWLFASLWDTNPDSAP